MIALISLSNCIVSVVSKDYEIIGTTPIIPDVVVKYNGQALCYGVDYTFDVANNTKPGMGRVTVTGVGKYTGVKVLNFKIVAARLKSENIVLEQREYKYDAFNPKPIIPELQVIIGGIVIPKEQYVVTCRNNTLVGTAEVEVRGIKGLQGIGRTTFKITR